MQSQQPFVTRLGVVIEAATTGLDALDDRRQTCWQALAGPPSRTQQCQRKNTAARPLGRADPVHRSSKRSFHGYLDRIRLRRLKKTLHSKGAWQQVARNMKTCATRMSPTSGSTTWTHAQEVFSLPNDFVTNVQKRLGNGTWTGFGQCRLCGSFLDLQPEHGEICSTAEATRGHSACVHAVLGGLELADPGTPTEPRGLTESQSRPADLFTTAAVPGRSAALDVCVASPMQQQLVEILRRQPLIVICHTTDKKFQIFVVRASFPVPLVWTADGHPTLPPLEHYRVQQTSHPAATANKCRQHHFSTDGNTKSRSPSSAEGQAMTRAVFPNPSARAGWLLAVASVEDERQHDETAGEEQPDTLRKTVRIEQEGPKFSVIFTHACVSWNILRVVRE